MRAVRFHGVGGALVVEDVPVPDVGRGEVLVGVGACGVCATDVHMIDGSLPLPVRPPFTPGHEAAGTVVVVGADVVGWSEGDRATIVLGRRCGRCRRCAQGGDVDACWSPATMGFNCDGGWAEYVAVPHDALVRIPRHVPLDVAAILSDAVATPYNATLDAGRLRPGERCAIFGIGGLGTHGVMLARLAGASFVAAVDPSAAARARAAERGADLTIDPTADDPAIAIRDATGGEGVDLAVDFVGANAVLKQAVASLAIDGRAVIAGVSGERIELGPSLLFATMRSSLLSVLGYRRSHLEALVDLVASGRLDLSGSISERLPLERADEAVEILREQRGDPVRVVLMPSLSPTAQPDVIAKPR